MEDKGYIIPVDLVETLKEVQWLRDHVVRLNARMAEVERLKQLPKDIRAVGMWIISSIIAMTAVIVAGIGVLVAAMK